MSAQAVLTITKSLFRYTHPVAWPKMKIFMVAFCADKKATFSPTKRQLTKRLLVAFSSVAFEPVYRMKVDESG